MTNKRKTLYQFFIISMIALAPATARASVHVESLGKHTLEIVRQTMTQLNNSSAADPSLRQVQLQDFRQQVGAHSLALRNVYLNDASLDDISSHLALFELFSSEAAEPHLSREQLSRLSDSAQAYELKLRAHFRFSGPSEISPAQSRLLEKMKGIARALKALSMGLSRTAPIPDAMEVQRQALARKYGLQDDAGWDSINNAVVVSKWNKWAPERGLPTVTTIEELREASSADEANEMIRRQAALLLELPLDASWVKIRAALGLPNDATVRQVQEELKRKFPGSPRTEQPGTQSL